MTTDVKTVPLSSLDSWFNLKHAFAPGIDMLIPPPDRTADTWAEQERKLGTTHAEGGNYRTDRTPYCRDIMRTASRTDVKRAVVIMGSRMGKTMSMQNIAGYYLHDDPSLILHVCQTRENANGEVRREIEEMIRSCKKLSALQITGKGTNQLTKEFMNGGVYKLVWAGSPSQLAGMNARIVIVDELDRVPSNSEGSVLTQAAARAKAYGLSGFVLATSTPTTGKIETYVHKSTGMQHWAVGKEKDIQSAIWREWQHGTRHEWAVKCPKCSDYFVPRFELLTWSGNTTQEAMDSAGLACFKCGEILRDGEDKKFIEENGLFLSPGEYVDDNGEIKGEGVRSPIISHWVSGLMNPWVSFADAAGDWFKAKVSENESDMKAVINTGFGELYSYRAEVMAWEAVKLCEGDYQRGTVPNAAQALYLTVDVQGDRLIWLVRAWNNQLTSWLVDHGEIFGPTDEIEVWDELEKVSNRQYSGRAIDMVGVDSGYRTFIVYDFCLRNLDRYRAFKGIGNKTNKLVDRKVTQATAHFIPKPDRFGVIRINAQDGSFKEFVHSRVKRAVTPYKDWFTFSGVSEDYCRQIVNDVQHFLPSGKTVWEEQGDNHYMDCEWMQRALAEDQGIRHWPDAVEESVTVKKKSKHKKQQNSWLIPNGRRKRY